MIEVTKLITALNKRPVSDKGDGGDRSLFSGHTMLDLHAYVSRIVLSFDGRPRSLSDFQTIQMPS